MLRDLCGKRVVILGAGGLGSACAQAFVDHGAKVALIDHDEETLELAAKRLCADVPVHVADVTDRASCRAALSATASVLGGLDVLVHAVGVNERKPVADVTVEDWDLGITTNLASALWSAQAAAELMSASGGQVVMLSSVSGVLGHPAHGLYAASKGGMNQLIKVMAIEWATKGIRVNGVAPGYTPTALTHQHLLKPGVQEALEAKVPMGRLGTPEDIAGPVLFLASEMSGFITGQVLLVDGGRTLD